MSEWPQLSQLEERHEQKQTLVERPAGSWLTTLGADPGTYDSLHRSVTRKLRNVCPTAWAMASVWTDAARVVIKALDEKLTLEAVQSIPRTLDGVPVVIEEVGRIVAY